MRGTAARDITVPGVLFPSCSLGRWGAEPGAETRIFLILPILPILLRQLQFAA
jgi:hypothetical protein